MQKTNYLLLFLTGLLIFTLPIPGTIALRNLLAVVILVIMIVIFVKYKPQRTYDFPKELKTILWLFVVLTMWIVITAFLSKETAWSLGEIKGQWITPMLYFIAFILLAIYSLTQRLIKPLYTVIFIALFIHILYIDIFALQHYLETDTLISRVKGLTKGPDDANYLTNILLAFIMAEIIYRFKCEKQMLIVNNYILVLLFLAIIFSSLVEGMRNGVVAIVFLGITSLFFMLYKNSKRTKTTKFAIMFIIIATITAPLLYNANNDSRWDSLIETIPIALDTETNQHWFDKNSPIPKLSNGENVSASNYERIAWGYEGLKLIIKDPIGYGFGRNAFGHAIKEKYGQYPTSMHSHSGIIDLGIGTGIIGVLLWVVIGIYITILSYQYFIRYHSFFALISLFSTTGFYARFLVDSNMRDHVFLMFLSLMAMSVVFMLSKKHAT